MGGLHHITQHLADRLALCPVLTLLNWSRGGRVAWLQESL